MNIIEREIKKREDLIVEREKWLSRATELEAEVVDLRNKAANTDISVLSAEIEELREYLTEAESPAVDTGEPV